MLKQLSLRSSMLTLPSLYPSQPSKTTAKTKWASTFRFFLFSFFPLRFDFYWKEPVTTENTTDRQQRREVKLKCKIIIQKIGRRIWTTLYGYSLVHMPANRLTIKDLIVIGSCCAVEKHLGIEQWRKQWEPCQYHQTVSNRNGFSWLEHDQLNLCQL